MPTYSYRCTECQTAFDIQQAFTDDNLTECPNCGGRLRKLFNSIGVTFNGSGFYRTDSRTPPKEGGSGGGETPGGKPEKKPGNEKKSDKKTESASSTPGSTSSSTTTASGSSS